LFKQEKIEEDKMARTLLGAPRKVPTKNAQCAKIGNVLYTSGVPFNWDTGEIVGKNSIQEQTKQTMENIKTTLEACGSSMDNIDKCTIYTPTYFPPDSTPARACIIAGLAHPDLMLEIEVIAHVED
jgi:2-iminobutanoate/2-iminopropanoate deaminase